MARTKRLALEAIYDTKTFDEKSLRQPQWLADGRLSYLEHWPGTEVTTVWTMDPSTRDAVPVVDPGTLREEGAEAAQTLHSVQWSLDGSRFLFTQEAPARFRACGDVFVYDVAARSFRRLTRTSEPQRHPGFSPDGSRVGLVRADDLWVVDVATGEERRLTFDAGPTVYNGRTGWVYEEELGLARSWQWSPDGTRIAFLQQDESNVPEVLLSQFDQPHADPRVTRYPKAGDPNPTVRLGVVAVDTAEVRWLGLPGQHDEEFYVAALQWAPGGQGILVQRVPRLQNRLDLLLVNPASGEVTTVLTETDEAWVDHPGELRFLDTSDRFIWPSERDGWRHLYLYSLAGDCVQLTRGQWDVGDVIGLDCEAGAVNYTAARPDPTQRQLWRGPLDGASDPRPLQELPGWHSALFSKQGFHYVHTHSTVNTPPTTTLRGTDGGLLHTFIDNAMPGAAVLLPNEWEFVTFETSDGQTLHARIMKPRGFDPSRKYPVLMSTYGGPGSQVVTDSWPGKGGLWYRMLAERGFVLAAVDNRGTGARGRAFKKQTYLRLGHWEVNDQVEGARWLGTLPYVDASRIGIWGWSYGGYTAAMCITVGADVFRAAVAVAPVTDWRLYDTIYTERYMRTPAENEDGYRDGSPVNHAGKLEGRLLIAHGTMDDNVHFQNAARLASALQDAGKPFEVMVYPGKHHGIEDRHLHLFAHMTDFWERTLGRRRG